MLKRLWKSTAKFFKTNYGLITLLLIGSIFLFPKVKSYYKDVYYEDQTLLTKKGLPNQLIPGAIVTIKLRTSSAFMPYEKIRVRAEIRVVNDTLKNLFAKSKSISLRFNTSHFTNDSINKLHISKYYDVDFMKYMNKGVMLNMTNSNLDNDNYVADAEIMYTKPGDFPVAIVYDFDLNPHVFTSIKIDGTTVDVLNKKNNELVYVLTVMNIMLFIYTLFGKKKD